MPFTPFHMGAALIVKPVLDRKLSVITFGIAQIAMDIEPGLGMLTGASVLHGPTHTILGALFIAFLVALIAPSICGYLLRRWNREVNHYGLSWLLQDAQVSKATAMRSALFGTLSHVALDSLIHYDMQPLYPFSEWNPLLGLIEHDGVYQLCALGLMVGGVAWLFVKWFAKKRQP